MNTPSSKWRANGEKDPHEGRYECERHKLTLGKMTDDELANAAFMHDHKSFDVVAILLGEPSSIALLDATKERIRWLSRNQDNLREALIAALEWIDSVPDDTVLPTMPGFDRDEVNYLIERTK